MGHVSQTGDIGLQPRGREMEPFAMVTLVAEAHYEHADNQCSALQVPSAAEAPQAGVSPVHTEHHVPWLERGVS